MLLLDLCVHEMRVGLERNGVTELAERVSDGYRVDDVSFCLRYLFTHV
jgi:hypothetical protein